MLVDLTNSKVEQQATVSKVLHVRNLPADCTEQELVGLASPFGNVTSVLVLKVRFLQLLYFMVFPLIK
jgi:hypothetical protein